MSSQGRGVAFGTIGFGAVAAGAALLLVLGPPRDRSVPRVTPTPAPPAVSAAGFTLSSAAIDLPSDDVALPPGPDLAVVQANCTACHSAAMIVSQPPLTRAQWEGEVKKMREVYHAPVDPAAVPAIVAYLTTLNAPSPATAPAPPARSAPTPSRSPASTR